jgi:hypothetical protein
MRATALQFVEVRLSKVLVVVSMPGPSFSTE